MISMPQIEKYLAKYIQSSDVTLNYSNKVIREDRLGEYTAKTLRLRLKNKEIVLEPIGTNMIGAKGRIDMEGDAGIVKFVLVESERYSPRVPVKIKTGSEADKDTVAEKTR